MKRIAIAALAVLALGAVIAGAQVVTNPVIPPPTVCAYNTAPPTLSSGQASWLQCDSTGALITASGGGGITAAVTVANGADVAEGNTADAAVTPLACAPLAPNGIASVSYAPGPPGVFGTGITAVVTSAATCFTKTTGVITAFISGSVQ